MDRSSSRVLLAAFLLFAPSAVAVTLRAADQREALADEDQDDVYVLPTAWEKRWDEDEAAYYYYNEETGVATWEKPAEVAEAAAMLIKPLKERKIGNLKIFGGNYSIFNKSQRSSLADIFGMNLSQFNFTAPPPPPRPHSLPVEPDIISNFTLPASTGDALRTARQIADHVDEPTETMSMPTLDGSNRPDGAVSFQWWKEMENVSDLSAQLSETIGVGMQQSGRFSVFTDQEGKPMFATAPELDSEVQKTYFYDARDGKRVAVIEMAHHKWLEQKLPDHLNLFSCVDNSEFLINSYEPTCPGQKPLPGVFHDDQKTKNKTYHFARVFGKFGKTYWQVDRYNCGKREDNAAWTPLYRFVNKDNITWKDVMSAESHAESLDVVKVGFESGKKDTRWIEESKVKSETVMGTLDKKDMLNAGVPRTRYAYQGSVAGGQDLALHMAAVATIFTLNSIHGLNMVTQDKMGAGCLVNAAGIIPGGLTITR